MTRVFRSAGAYVQGPAVLDAAAAHLDPLDAERAVLVGGETALATVEDRLRDALRTADVAIAALERGVDACTPAIIDEGASLVAEAAADLVVGVGGGTAIDASKAIAGRAGATFVSVPTVASTDAPASAVSVVYDEDGRRTGAVLRERNPELVLVDTAVVAAAPARFLRHGMGDALATRFEAEATARSGGVTVHGDEPTETGLAAARRCFDVLAEHGPEAATAATEGTVTPALDAVIEANVLLSGIGFENGGLAAAHAMETGCRAVAPGTPHGVVVAFCTLAQLVLEDHEEVEAVRDLLVDLGLATTLSDLGVEGSLDVVAETACAREIMANEPVDVSPEVVTTALRRADTLLSA